jgi:uncharacterized protein (TIGR02246 family)
MPSKHQSNRPALGVEGAEMQEAIDAVACLVEELQAGWDQHDADLSNRHFAADVMWGSPCGAAVQGYDELHAIHGRLKQQRKGGASSRFEIVRVFGPASGMAVAQVRRVALGADGEPVKPSDNIAGSFSEMALYVIIRRGGVWCLLPHRTRLSDPRRVERVQSESLSKLYAIRNFFS